MCSATKLSQVSRTTKAANSVTHGDSLFALATNKVKFVGNIYFQNIAVKLYEFLTQLFYLKTFKCYQLCSF